MKPCRLVQGWLFAFAASCCGCALVDPPDDSPGETLLAEAAERNAERKAERIDERAANRTSATSDARHARESDSSARKGKSRHAANEAVSIKGEYDDHWPHNDADSGSDDVAESDHVGETKRIAVKKARDAAKAAPPRRDIASRASDESPREDAADDELAVEKVAVDEARTFDGMIADARASGGMSAEDETTFRRDLAAMPSALRPQMAAMMLAMRAKSKSDAPARKTNAGELSPRERAERATDGRASTEAGASHRDRSLTTAPTYDDTNRVTHAARAEPIGDNPLRLTDGMRASAANAASTVVPANRQRSESNAPAQIESPSANLSGQPATTASLATPSSVAAPSTNVQSTAAPAAGRSAEPLADDAADDGRARTPAEWQVLLSASVRTLEDQLARLPKGEENAELEARLRMLYLIANRQDDALRPMPADAKEQQFWREWLMGTSVYLDAKTMPSDANRAAAAANRLREAVHRLGEQGSLQISNLTFCRRVTSYGVYEKFTSRDAKDEVVADKRTGPESVFLPDQEVLLYAEIHNFTSRQSPTGYETILKPSYQIFEGDRRVGSVVELDESRDYCRQQRNDFFVCYHIYLPKRIDPGMYRLKLTIEDVHGKKVSESNIEFAIK